MINSLPRLMLFSMILLIIVFFIYVYPVAALAHLLIGSAIFTMHSFGMTLILAVLIFYYLRSHSTAAILSGLTHYGMGVGFMAFGVVNIGLLAQAIFASDAFMIGMLSLLVTLGLSGKAIYNGRALHIKNLSLTSPKITKPLRLIFISDVHLGSNPKTHLDKICEIIHQLDYDALLIGGDLFDSSSFQLSDLSAFKKLEKPIYYITGNHEYYVKNHQTKIEALRDYNLKILADEAALFKGIQIIGIDDYHTPKEQADIAQKLTDPDLYNLVLVHQPALWGALPKEADLMLSGHTHNGQLMPFHWLVRLQFKAVYGLYQQGTNQAYVSSGAGTWGPRMRLGTQNEIIDITLLPSADK